MFNLILATLEDLVVALDSGEISSEWLVGRYLDAIDRDNVEGFGLRGVIQTASRAHLIKVAKRLDAEREASGSRGKLHGIPVIIKDSFDVTDRLGFRTAAGTVALLHNTARRNSTVVQRLIDRGAIILGTANISTLSSAVSTLQPGGWSPTGGQAKSAHGDGLPPGLSSTGCAVALSAGFCAVSVGEETDCSLNCPANCAGLYALKATPSLIPSDGIAPISNRQDSTGPMGKSPWDLAAVFEALVEGPSRPDYFSAVAEGSAQTVSDFRVGVYNPCKWDTYDISRCYPDLIAECHARYEDAIKALRPVIPRLACDAVTDIMETPWEIYVEDGKLKGHADPIGIFAEFSVDFEKYLKGHEGPIKSLEGLIAWMDQNPESSFHPDSIRHPNRAQLLKLSASLRHSYRDEYRAARVKIEEWRKGILEYMDREELDVIIVKSGVLGYQGPIVAAPTGMPAGTIPIGSLSSGAPISFYVIGRPFHETTLLRFMAAAEKVLPSRAVPWRMLRGASP